MRADIQISIAENALLDNEVFKLRGDWAEEIDAISAVSWCKRGGDHDKIKVDLLKHIYNRIKERYSELGIWIVGGTFTWQSDSKVLRYKWRTNPKMINGVQITHAGEPIRKLFEQDGKIKFLSALRISELSISSVVEALFKNSYTFLLVVSDSLSIEPALDRSPR